MKRCLKVLPVLILPIGISILIFSRNFVLADAKADLKKAESQYESTTKKLADTRKRIEGTNAKIQTLLSQLTVTQQEITDLQIRFFVGYSGWSAGQLQEEVEEKSWIITTPDVGISFSLEAEQIWKRSMQQLGGEYAQMTNYPIDPQLN